MKYIKMFESFVNESGQATDSMAEVNAFTKSTMTQIGKLESEMPILKGLSAATKELRSKYTSKHPDYASANSLKEYAKSLASFVENYEGVAASSPAKGSNAADLDVDLADNKEKYGKILTDKIAKSAVALEGLAVLKAKAVDNLKSSGKEVADIKPIREMKGQKGNLKTAMQNVVDVPTDLGYIDTAIAVAKENLESYVYSASDLANAEPGFGTRVLAAIF